MFTFFFFFTSFLSIPTIFTGKSLNLQISSAPLCPALSIFPWYASNAWDFQGPTVWGWEGTKQNFVCS